MSTRLQDNASREHLAENTRTAYVGFTKSHILFMELALGAFTENRHPILQSSRCHKI